MIPFSRPAAASLLVASLLGCGAPLPLAAAAVLATDAEAEDGPRLEWLDVDQSKVGLRNFALAEGGGDAGGRARADDEVEGGEKTIEVKEGDAKSGKNKSGKNKYGKSKRNKSTTRDKADKYGKTEKSSESSESERSGSGSQRDEPVTNMHDHNQIREHVRIIGGREAPEDFYSFTVGLSDRIGLFCGGSLIAKDVVLSAAHCQGTPYSAVVGRHDLRDNDGEEIKARRELPHPSYNPARTDNDFMLVFLEEPTTQDVDIIKVNADPDKPRVGKTGTVMGWGDTDIRDDVSELSDVLLEVDVNVISNNQCDASSGKIDGFSTSYNDQITKNMLCANANMRDACQGDSGGPLVLDDGGGEFLQVGVVSWGIGCAHRDFPGVYARLSRAYDWIEREVCRGSDYAEEAGFKCGGGGGGLGPAASPSGGGSGGLGPASSNNNPRPTRRPKKKPTKKPNKQPKPSNNEKPFDESGFRPQPCERNHRPVAPVMDHDDLRKHLRIIGGREAPEDFFSFTVGLTDHIGLFCGGSLITKDVVLSAAHCQGTPYNALIGRHDLRDNDGEEIKARRELPHPSYNPERTDNDFMLVFLEEPTTRDVDIVKVNSNPAMPRVGETCTVMGWGDTDIRGDVSELSDVLLEVDVNVISNNQCDRSSGKIDGFSTSYNDQISQNMLCANANMRDACQGDSGGPLVVDDGGEFTQVGVVSWGIGCAHRDFPGVYARLSRAYDWIEREVCRGSDYAEEAGFKCHGGGGGGGGGGGVQPVPSPPCGGSNDLGPAAFPSGGGSGGLGPASSNNNPTPTRRPRKKPTKKPRPTKRPRKKPAKKPNKQPKPSNPKPSNNEKPFNDDRFDDDLFNDDGPFSCWPRCEGDLTRLFSDNDPPEATQI